MLELFLFHPSGLEYVGLDEPCIVVRYSLGFDQTQHLTNLAICQASKSAIESFVRTWNNEFGTEHGITVNAVNPGPVKYVQSFTILLKNIKRLSST